MPLEWVVRTQSPDYGIDFQVEIFKGERPTGLLFEVQLKGVSEARLANGVYQVRLSTDHLRHYVQDRVLPVIIVFVEVRSAQVFWISADVAAAQLASSTGFHQKKYVTIKIPASQVLPASIHELSNTIHQALAPARGLLSDGGCLIFVDDYCYCIDPDFARLAAFRFEFGLRLATGTRVSQVIVTFATAQRTSTVDGWIFKPGLVLLATVDELGFRVEPREPSELGGRRFDGLPAKADMWHAVAIEVTPGEVVIEVDGSRRSHALASSFAPWNSIVLGALVKEHVQCSMLNGAIQNARLVAPESSETVFHWTFPRIEPGLDLSGHRRHLREPTTAAAKPLRVSLLSEEVTDWL